MKLYNSYDNFGNGESKEIPQIKNEILTQLDFFVSAYQVFTKMHKNEKFLWPSNIGDIKKDLELWKNNIPEEYKRFILAVEELINTKKYTKFKDEVEISNNDPSIKLKTPQMWMSIGLKVVEEVDTKLKRFEETNSNAKFKRGVKTEVNKEFLKARKKFLVDNLLEQIIEKGQKYLNDYNNRNINYEQNLLLNINNFKFAYENYLFEFHEYEIPNDYYEKVIKMCDDAKKTLNDNEYKRIYLEVYKTLFSFV